MIRTEQALEESLEAETLEAEAEPDEDTKLVVGVAEDD